MFDTFGHSMRKSKLVDVNLQLLIAIEILLHSFMWFAFIIMIVYVAPLATMFSNLSLEAHQDAVGTLIEININKWPLLIIAAVLVALVTVLFSHRIVGPYFKVAKLMREYAGGDLRSQFYLRKHDYFQELTPIINNLVDRLNNDLGAARKELAELERQAQGLKDESAKRSIQERLAALQQALAAYQLRERTGEEKHA